MPIALFTPANRTSLAIASHFPDAAPLASGADEDVFQIGRCRVTCRFWAQGGDFVSKQILGCGTAVRSGQLRCVDIDATERQIDETQAVIGIVGPEDAVRVIASRLASCYSGVLVDGDAAVMA